MKTILAVIGGIAVLLVLIIALPLLTWIFAPRRFMGKRQLKKLLSCYAVFLDHVFLPEPFLDDIVDLADRRSALAGGRLKRLEMFQYLLSEMTPAIVFLLCKYREWNLEELMYRPENAILAMVEEVMRKHGLI